MVDAVLDVQQKSHKTAVYASVLLMLAGCSVRPKFIHVAEGQQINHTFAKGLLGIMFLRIWQSGIIKMYSAFLWQSVQVISVDSRKAMTDTYKHAAVNCLWLTVCVDLEKAVQSGNSLCGN